MSAPAVTPDVASPQGIVNIILGTLLIVSEVLAMIPKSPYRGVMQSLGALVTKMMADEKSVRTSATSTPTQSTPAQQTNNLQSVLVNSA